MIKLDYSLQTPEERNELVQRIIEEQPEPNQKYLEILADYLILCMEKQEKKEKKINYGGLPGTKPKKRK